MRSDRNKTEITKLVTAAAALYLEERGCKPIETEVPITYGWVADLGAVLFPTQTELIELRLLKRKPPYRHPDFQAWQQRAKACQRLMTVLVEVKTSRSDFAADKKWTLPIPVNLAYLALPDDLLTANIPAGWGVLAYSSVGNYVRCVHAPTINEVTAEQQLSVVHSIAVRRDHHTRYERLRELQRETRIEQNAEVSRMRCLDAMRAMQSIVEGRHGSVAGALEYHGIKHMPQYFLPELGKLFGIAAKHQSAGAGQ